VVSFVADYWVVAKGEGERAMASNRTENRKKDMESIRRRRIRRERGA
jgi:hypothetical protein